MESRYRLRIYLLTAMVLFGCGVLLTRLYEFQIEKKDHYRDLVPGDRPITVREPGIRGEIRDRNGIALARNRRKYEVTFNLEEIHQAYRLQSEDPKRKRVETINGVKGVKDEADIVRIVNEMIIPPLTRLGLAKNYSAKALRTHYITHGGLVPYPYRSDLDYDQFARFAEHSLELPGVYLDLQTQREYPYGALAAHMLGYVQDWHKDDIPEDAKRIYNHYVGDPRGITGLEQTYNHRLVGPEGKKTLLKNEKGKILGLLDYIKPGVGADVTLTIDASVQYLVSSVLRRAGTAAAVVMDVNTGEILAMASVPDYDPNHFVPSISFEQDKIYQTNPHKPFIDRSISAFQPGSTFKIPTALAGSLHGIAGRGYMCSGGVNYGTQRVRCWIEKQSGGSHGFLNLQKAIQQSCNPFFMQMANNVGAKDMLDAFHLFGFGVKTGIPVPGEQAGMLIGDRNWLQLPNRTRPSPVDVAFFSIGQAESMATPLQLCALTAAVANGGKYYAPRLIKKVVAQDGVVLEEDKPNLKVDLLREGVRAADIEQIRMGMSMAVNKPGGTAGRLKMKEVEVAAKTGTAQAPGNTFNAWTVCFAPYDSPRYAICVLVRNGKSGGKVATPLAHLILSGLIARDQGSRLPLQRLDPVPGNLDQIEEITLPEKILAAIDIIADSGETGEEASEAGAVPANSVESEKPIIVKPLITPDVDAEGSVVPRARPVDE